MKKQVYFIISLFAFAALLLNSAFKMKEPTLRIALSAGSDNYKNYILRSDSTVEIIDMRGLDAQKSIELLQNCDGIIFTGGEDVEPSYYGKAGDSARCTINHERDIQEFALIQEALALKMPIFGICRGQQILNVALGGTLIVDIPQDYKTEIIHREEDYLKCYHPVSLKPNTVLFSICKTSNGLVSSNHHQAIEKLAPGMMATAFANDGIIEAIEWENPTEKPFFIAVQWHPERMDEKSEMSMPIMRKYLTACRNNKNK
jgi:putative glutamine amidotransferase